MTKRIGPLPRFCEVHVRRALELIAERGKVGRKDLAKELGIGEGSVRTILNSLKKEGLVISKRGRIGHLITEKGIRTLGKAHDLVRLDAGGMSVGEVDVATIVRGAADKVKRGIEQRDEAIKAGADGATVLVFRGGRLQFPDNFMEVDEELSKSLLQKFKPNEGDVIIIGTGKDVARAEEGAKAAARSLMKCW